MMSVFVVKSPLTEKADETALPVFKTLADAKKLGEEHSKAIPGGWVRATPERWLRQSGAKIKSLWRNTADSAVSVTELSVRGGADDGPLTSILLVRFNTYRKRDLFLGAAANLEEARAYAESVINAWLKDDVTGDVSRGPRAFDGSAVITWYGEATSGHESLVAVVEKTDSLLCLIERTPLLDAPPCPRENLL